MNDDFHKQQMEKEANKKHIDKLDEKIQQADMQNEKVQCRCPNGIKKSVLSNVSTKVFALFVQFLFRLQVFWYNNLAVD